MKKSILLLSFICLACVAMGQTKVHDCPKGYSWMPSMSTSSLIIKADTCLPDSSCKKLWKIFEENMCGETGFYASGNGYSEAHINTWDDSRGCSTRHEYRHLVKGKWVLISKKEYEKHTMPIFINEQ